MLALFFILLAGPLALVAFFLGAFTATRYHRARLPALLERTANGVRDRLNAELGALIAEIDAGRELPKSRAEFDALMQERGYPAAD